MTQPSTPPPTGPLVNTLGTLAPCASAPSWIAPFTTPQDAWNGCPYGDWLLWFCFRQAPNLAERQRLAGCLATMLSTYVTAPNMPDAPSLASAQALLTSIQGFAANTVTASQLRKALGAMTVYMSPVTSPPTAPTAQQSAQHDIGAALSKLALCLITSDSTTAANMAISLGTILAILLVDLGQASGQDTALTALAPMIRAAIPFQNFVPPAS